MSIDKQRVRGVEMLEQLGFRWDGIQWVGPAGKAQEAVAAADKMHGVLMDRAERLAGAIVGSDDEQELAAIGEALEDYEAARWPLGKIPGGKG